VSEIDYAARRRRPPRRRAWLRAVAAVAGGLVLLAAGYGLGRALDDNPDPGPAVTTIRDLKPLPAVTTTS